jgi:threonine/homoserine/homoserine lactone efflux protein
MTLAFTLGLSIGYRRTLWMMLGEMVGVATVFISTFWGLGWLLSRDPLYFKLFSLIGGAYLLYLSLILFRQPPEKLMTKQLGDTSSASLTGLGFITAVSNPKGWAFLVALLPGFVVTESPLGSPIRDDANHYALYRVSVDDTVCDRRSMVGNTASVMTQAY